MFLMSLNPIPFTPTEATCSFEFGLALRVIAGKPSVDAASTVCCKKERLLVTDDEGLDMPKPTPSRAPGFHHLLRLTLPRRHSLVTTCLCL
jgi:hypothetical protein